MSDEHKPNQDDEPEMSNPWPEESVTTDDNRSDARVASDDEASNSSDSSETVEDKGGSAEESTPTIEPVVPPETPQATAPAVQPTPVVGQPPIPPVATVENPGQTLGIVSIVLGALAIWIIGLPLAIISTVKSSKAQASKTLGIVGLVLNIFSLIASTLLIIIIVASIPYIVDRAKDAESANNAAIASSGNVITLSTDYKPIHADVSFGLPATYRGWTSTGSEKDGVTEFTKADNSATFMTYHGVLAGMTGNDQLKTQSAMADYISQLEMVEVSNSESTVMFTCESDNKLLEFETKEVTGTSDGRAVKGIVAVRMYEGHELSVIYLADIDSFNVDEWVSMTSAVTIKDGVL